MIYVDIYPMGVYHCFFVVVFLLLFCVCTCVCVCFTTIFVAVEY